MSQALQCTQFDALICSFLPPAAVRDHFIDVGGTKVGAGVAEFGDAARGAQRRVGDAQMHRLTLIVRRRGKEHERDPVARRQLPVAPVAVGRGVLVQALERLVVGVIGERPRRRAPGHVGFKRCVGKTKPQAAIESRANIAHLVQFAAAGRCAPARVEALAACRSRRSARRQSCRSGSPDESP